MIVGTVVIFRQVQFARNRPVGYEMDRIVSINSGPIANHFESFRNDLLASGKFLQAAMSETGVSNTFITNSGFNWSGKDPAMQEEFTTLGVTTTFGKTVNWKILEGRDFSGDFASDSSGIIINETAAKYLGFDHPVGEILQWGKKDQVHIIGVVKDMITQSPYQPVKQSFFYLRKGYLGTINARVNPVTPMPEALTELKTLYEKYNPTDAFEYGFLDEEYAKNFATELRVGKLATWFAVLAIFISCLGLFGMASFVAEQRTKEIGVRKVLGASILNLWKLLSTDFIIIVFISFVIATPIAWYFMNSWLQNYQYRAPLSWWIFAAAGAAALLVTLITISFKTIRAAQANPVKSLRTE
jgi:ABC-type antimicrobial peptide transport system permease subunit